jgi:hypothetical protein
MLLLRTIAILMAIAIVVSAVLWLLTGQRTWFDRSIRLLKAGVVVGLLFFGILAIERLT